MSKPVKYTVAVILKNSQNPKEFLVVKRPADDNDLAGHWGLPAVTLNEGELPGHGAIRACKEKLNCNAQPDYFVGIMFQKRNNYDIFLMDIEMTLKNGEQPKVEQAITNNTAYVDQKWTTEPLDLMPSAKSGSCCSSIFLTHRGLLDRSEWVESLEGSNTVG